MAHNRLKEIRKELDLTQAQMAETLGLKRNNITHLEMGKTTLTKLHALAIEHLFGIRAGWLLEGVGEKYAKKVAPVTQTLDEVTKRHADLVTQFKNKREAYLGNCDLLEIEMVSEATFNRTIGYIKGVKETLVETSDKRNPKGLAVGKKAVNDK